MRRGADFFCLIPLLLDFVFRGDIIRAMKKNIKNKEVHSFNAVFLEEEDGGYSVSVPSLSGCFSQGDTFEEAAANIKEAIELYLETEDEIFTEYYFKKEFMVPVQAYG